MRGKTLKKNTLSVGWTAHTGVNEKKLSGHEAHRVVDDPEHKHDCKEDPFRLQLRSVSCLFEECSQPDDGTPPRF